MFAAVRRTGLVPRGAFNLAEDERAGELAGIRTIVLAGMVGRDGWDAFAASPEARDGLEHPLDRWSRRLIESLARELGGKALFPFGGPPFLPFQRWAQRAEFGPFLADWPVNSPALRPLACLPRRAWLAGRACSS